jgi:DNA polymerase-2
MSVRGLILDTYEAQRHGKAAVCLVGRLESGETFGILDEAPRPRLYVRASDAARAGVGVEATSLVTMDGEAVVKAGAATVRGLRAMDRELQAKGVRTYEADVDPCRIYLRERGIRAGVAIEGVGRASPFLGRVFEAPALAPAQVDAPLRCLSFDIETDTSLQKVLAISLVVWGAGVEAEEVEVLPEPELLRWFSERVRAHDPDVLTGWNVVDFDLATLTQRFAAHGLPTRLGRTREPDEFRPGRRGTYMSSRMIVRGRQVLDALRLVRGLPQRFDDLRLGTVGAQVVGRGKTIVAEEWQSMPELIERKYREDPAAFAAYCLEDARLVRDILKKEGLIELSVGRSQLIGLPLERSWGSVAAFENIYMMRLNQLGIVAPTSGVDGGDGELAPGGLVMEPQVGLYRDILVFDFKSLYPSIMRTFNIDPLAHERAGSAARTITAPNGAPFAFARGILPVILDEFTASREAAKRAGDKVGAYVYKILMNSFYGVLGTDSCRFASGAMAGAITGFGHVILRWMRKHFEACGFTVLYGDTDSLFVDTGLADAAARGAELCVAANAALAAWVQAEYGVESRLELEFEKCYARFLLPAARGGEGRAKSYAGLKDGVLEVTGMEAVRSDWTEAAKELQLDLLRMLFHDATGPELTARFHAEVAAVRRGERDAALVYRRTIRKPLKDYASNAPHVRAASLLPRPVRVVRYLMTRDGAQPLGFVRAPIDYDHYIERQLLPIAEGLAPFGGFRARLPEAARSLFGD